MRITIETVNSPIESFDFGRQQWDLIVFCYLDPRPYVDKVLAALKPGGLLVVEGFHKRTRKTRLADGWFEDNELLRIFPTLRVLRYEDVLAKQDWGFQMIEPNRLVRFAAAGKEQLTTKATMCVGAPGRWRCDPTGWSRAGECSK